MIHDISPPIDSALCVWPGDTPPSREVICHINDGQSVTLSTLHATVHLGAHADAPSHYGLDAPSIERIALDRFIGRCQVVSVEVERGGVVVPDMIRAEITEPRVLIKTNCYPDPTDFNEDFAALSAELVSFMSEKGVQLIGVDAPSIDPFDSKALTAHKACLEHDIVILEGLVLVDVPDERYELIALPLRLVGFDASPVRAVLRTLGATR